MPFTSRRRKSELLESSHSRGKIEPNRRGKLERAIKLYSPKVLSGKFFGGHDYPFYGVGRTVQEFVDSHQLSLITSSKDWCVQMSARFQMVKPDCFGEEREKEGIRERVRN